MNGGLKEQAIVISGGNWADGSCLQRLEATSGLLGWVLAPPNLICGSTGSLPKWHWRGRSVLCVG